MGLSAALEAAPTMERPRVDREREALVGSRCRSCGVSSWPSRAVCYNCGSGDLEQVPLPPTGSLLTYTTVWVSRPGLTPPYTLGLVRLDDGVTLFAHLRSLPAEARVPLPVQLEVAAEAGAVPPFWFVPAAGDDQRTDTREDRA